MGVSIYALATEREGIRYVGATKNKLEYRLKGHLYTARKGEQTYRARWMRRCLRDGEEIRIFEIEEATEANWEERERYWIAHYNNLTNSCAGGGGVRNLTHTPAARAAIGAASRARGKTPEHLAKIAAANRGKKRSAETRAKIGANSKTRKGRVSEETKAKLRAKHSDRLRAFADAQRGRPLSPEHIEKKTAPLRGFRHSEAMKAKMVAVARARPPKALEAMRAGYRRYVEVARASAMGALI